MHLRIAARAGIADQSNPKMIVVRSSIWIQLDRLSKEMNRRVIFLSFEPRSSLLVIELGCLGGRHIRLGLSCPRHRFGDWSFSSPRQGSAIAASAVGRVEITARCAGLRIDTVVLRAVSGCGSGCCARK